MTRRQGHARWSAAVLGTALTLSLSLGALAWPLPLRAQTVINVPRNQPAYSQSEAEQALREVVPFVEYVAQRRFKRPPVLRLVNRIEYLALQRRQGADSRTEPAGEPPADGAHRADEAMSFATGAFYRSEDKLLYLIPANLTVMLAATNRPFDDRILILRHLVAHELVHALQDQEVGLPKLLNGKWYIEELTAVRSLVEGQATFVEDEVGRLLKDHVTFAELDRLIEPPIDPRTDPAQAGLQAALRLERARVYVNGSQFVRHFYRQGGMNRVWKLFESPPSDMGMILHPERYEPQKRAVRDYSSVFEKVAARVGRGPWQVASIQYGPWSLGAFRPLTISLTPAQQLLFGDKVVTCLDCIGVSPRRDASWTLSLLELTDAESAPAVLDVIRQNVFGLKPPTQPESRPFAKTAATSPAHDSAEPIQIALALSPLNRWFASARQGRYLIAFEGKAEGLTAESLTTLLQTLMTRVAPAPPAPGTGH